jgi:hydrophobe/amphiphile efflux-1 (HAE1) family protein
MSISTPFIRRPVATTLLTVGVLLLGAMGYRLLPVSALPTVDFPTIEVLTDLPGGSVDVVASSITSPLEAQLGQLPSLVSMSSISSFGRSAITLRFTLNRNIDAAAQDVQSAISSAAGLLPPSLQIPPTYSKVNPADAPIMLVALTSDSIPLSKVQEFASTVLSPKLSQVDGVGLVSVQGGQKRAVRVQIRPAALASLGLSLEDVRAAILLANVNAPKGSIDGDRQSRTIGANDQLLTADTYEDAILVFRNGAPIRVRDVGAAVEDVENLRLAAWYGDKPAILLEVRRQPGSNIIATVSRVQDLLNDLRSAVPAAIKVSVLSDRTETIRSSLAEVEFTFYLTIILVVAVIFLYLREPLATLIPSIAIPLSLISSFGVMYLCGFSLNNLSLMALTVATGFVVDDAIVMIENIARYCEQGLPSRMAAIRGAKEIAFTVVSLTLSLVAVFLPLLLMGGVIGRLFREFAVTLSAAVLISAAVSLTLTPMMCGQLLRFADTRKPRVFPWLDSIFDRQLAAYDRSLKFAFRHSGSVLLVTLLALVASIVLYFVIPKGFLPQQDAGLIVGVVDTAPDMSFRGLVERQRAILEQVRKDPDVATVASFVGVGTSGAATNIGQLSIALKQRRDRSSNVDQIIARLTAATAQDPDVRLYAQAVQDIQLDQKVSRTQYRYTLQTTDLTELQRWVPLFLAELEKQKQFQDLATDLQEGGIQARLMIDRQKASMMDVSVQAIDDILYDAFGQRWVSTIFTQLDQYHVILELDPKSREDISSLDLLYVPTRTGTQIPLKSLVAVASETRPLSIARLDRFPFVTLSFNLAPGVSLGSAVDAIGKARQEIGLPPTIEGRFSGNAAEFQESFSGAPVLILASILVVYIVLGVLYESFLHPITILSTLPSAGLGALMAMWLFGYEINLMTLIGIVLLIGIVKKNAIMMINFAVEAERSSGVRSDQAIYDACLLRFRPIMMTTMAAILGALPLALSGGAGAEFRRPLGLAIIGGLVLSQFLTLYSTPIVYVQLSRLRALALKTISKRARADGVVWPNSSPPG